MIEGWEVKRGGEGNRRIGGEEGGGNRRMKVIEGLEVKRGGEGNRRIGGEEGG